jgi:hypothetical protein
MFFSVALSVVLVVCGSCDRSLHDYDEFCGHHGCNQVTVGLEGRMNPPGMAAHFVRLFIVSRFTASMASPPSAMSVLSSKPNASYIKSPRLSLAPQDIIYCHEISTPKTKN